MTFNDKNEPYCFIKMYPNYAWGLLRYAEAVSTSFFPGNPPGSPRGLMGSLPTVITPFKGRLLSTYPFFFFFFLVSGGNPQNVLLFDHGAHPVCSASLTHNSGTCVL